MEQLLFYNFGGLAVICAILTILRKNPVTSALFLVACMFCLSALYVMLNAHFIAAAQVLVYAGAIMVLFLFVIMLLDLRKSENPAPSIALAQKAVGVFLALDCLVLIGLQVALYAAPKVGDLPKNYGTTELVARTLFTTYILPFELAGVLLLVAVVGAVVVAKREL
ncbi:MAG: NADH-quinone oxidoreductase subunit J [Deltaproteobacteria bacterium]|nr:NADH-quinone oxidoreductase subunit J [Deltaproteobacteria bacterium]